MKPIEPPWQAIKGWIFDDEPDLEWFSQSPTWRAPEILLDDGRILGLEPA